MPVVLDRSKFSAYLVAAMYALNVFAQDMSFNEQIKAVDRQYQNQILSAQSALSTANLNYTRCGMEANKGADGKANPDLEEAPDGTMALLQGVLPGVMQAAPALPEVLGKLGSAKSDSDTRRERAIDDYNGEITGFQTNYGGDLKSFKVDLGEKESANLKTSSSLRVKANAACLAHQADPMKYNRCTSEAQSLPSSLTELANRIDQAKSSDTATSTLTGAAISAAMGGFMAHMTNEKETENIEKQNEITQRVADNNLILCEGSANAEIENAKRSLAQLELDRADTLRDLALRNALAMNEIKAPLDDLGDEGDKTLPPINPGKPNGAKVKPAAEVAKNEAGGGGSAGGAPGAGGSSGGSPAWNFGGAPGNYLGGGLPTPESGAQFAGSGGGGSFSGGFGQDGGGLSLGDGTGGLSSAGGPSRGLASLSGDGGLQVMMARMRIRVAYHASELMQGVDLKSLAQKNPAAAGSVNATDAKDRAPASKF